MNTNIKARALQGFAVTLFFAAAMSLGQTFEKVHVFTANEGGHPQSGLIQLPGPGITLAGTTIGGDPLASFELGTLFLMTPPGNNQPGKLWTVHEFDWAFTGAYPHSPLLLTPDGDLYGAIMEGLFGWGGIYKLMPDHQTLNVAHAFIPSATEGALPHAPLILVPGATSSEGQYFGVTTEGGKTLRRGQKEGFGTIFSINDRGLLRTIHSFSGTDGAHPFEALLLVGQFMYGTTTGGGAAQAGVIYRIDIQGKNFSVVYNFNGRDGADPEAPLIQIDGALYGTTQKGGDYGLGTVFKYDLRTGSFTVLHDFSGGDGKYPHAGLVLANNGALYGTTSAGGQGVETPSGTIFKILLTPPLYHFQTVHTFDRYVDGADSESRMIKASDGALYGTTTNGGPADLGVIFRLSFATPPTSGATR